MNTLVKRYFQEESQFEEVLVLNQETSQSWHELRALVPSLPRGWYELSRLSPKDRVEFKREFWLASIPFHPIIHRELDRFFSSLDDVGIVLTKANSIWSVQLVYSLSDHSSFFLGLPPASSADIENLEEELMFSLPKDFIGFTKIHDGFGKLSEFGLLKTTEMMDVKRKLTDMLLKSERTVQFANQRVDAGSLIPFYEVYGLGSFQCFYMDWYPESEMGNVYFSGIDYTISDITRKDHWAEVGAFPTFSDWLIRYLEGMEVSF